VFDDLEIDEIAPGLDDRSPQAVIAWGLETFGDRAAIVTALQAGGLAILDMAARIRPDVLVITVDTGRLPQQTYDFVQQVRAHYPRSRWEILSPDPAEVQDMVARRGTELFRRSVAERMLCCQVRKVRPLARALRGVDAWFTGLRRDQSESRAAIRTVAIDQDHGGIVKISPLADWESQRVEQYNQEHCVPHHPLYAKGYTSIGCAPCTRPIEPGEDDRAGRWWWESGVPKECGIHRPMQVGAAPFEPGADLVEVE
jgi:phosphoadenosine phosphosulfate reductase